MRDLPTGTVTFLFTDMEGSTRLLERLGERYQQVQRHHNSILRATIAEGDGCEVSTEGDSFFGCVSNPDRRRTSRRSGSTPASGGRVA